MSLVVTFPPGDRFAAGFVQALVNEINTLRRDPKEYASRLYDPKYKDYDADEKRETEAFLNARAPCVPLRINPLLSEMAQNWTNIQGRRGDTGHGNISERLRQANIPLTGRAYAFAENIAYGFVEPQDIVVGWLIDHGVPNKGHRTNLLNCDYSQIGVGFGPHTNPNPLLSFRFMVVNEYGSGFATQRTTAPVRTTPTTTRLGQRRGTTRW